MAAPDNVRQYDNTFDIVRNFKLPDGRSNGAVVFQSVIPGHGLGQGDYLVRTSQTHEELTKPLTASSDAACACKSSCQWPDLPACVAVNFCIQPAIPNFFIYQPLQHRTLLNTQAFGLYPIRPLRHTRLLNPVRLPPHCSRRGWETQFRNTSMALTEATNLIPISAPSGLSKARV